jgi:ribonuclease P protein component
MALGIAWKTAGGKMCLAAAALKAAKGSPLAMSFTKSSLLKSFRFPSRLSYSIVASKGKRLKFGFLNLKALPAQDSCTRFCFVVKRKNGCAVFRNRCRRILRPIFFGAAKNFKEPLWIMVIVNMNSENADWEAFKACAKNCLSSL